LLFALSLYFFYVDYADFIDAAFSAIAIITYAFRHTLYIHAILIAFFFFFRLLLSFMPLFASLLFFAFIAFRHYIISSFSSPIFRHIYASFTPLMRCLRFAFAAIFMPADFHYYAFFSLLFIFSGRRYDAALRRY